MALALLRMALSKEGYAPGRSLRKEVGFKATWRLLGVEGDASFGIERVSRALRGGSDFHEASCLRYPLRDKSYIDSSAGTPPGGQSFESRAQRGKPRYEDAPAIVHAGISMFATPAQALSRARRYPKIVAKVFLERGIHLAKTYDAGHYTVWGAPEDLRDQAEVVIHKMEP